MTFMGFLLPPLLRTWPGRSCRRSSRPCRTRAGTRRGRCSCLLLQAGRRPETRTMPRAGRGGATSRMGGEETTGGISSSCTGTVGRSSPLWKRLGISRWQQEEQTTEMWFCRHRTRGKDFFSRALGNMIKERRGNHRREKEGEERREKRRELLFFVSIL